MLLVGLQCMIVAFMIILTCFFKRLSCFTGFHGILGQVWYLIVSIPDLCNLTYFDLKIILPGAWENPITKPLACTVPSDENCMCRILEIDLNFSGALVPQYVPRCVLFSSAPSKTFK